MALGVAEERGHLPFLAVRVGAVDHLAGAIAERDLVHATSVSAVPCGSVEAQACGFLGDKL
jgi:hypothetical protein